MLIVVGYEICSGWKYGGRKVPNACLINDHFGLAGSVNEICWIHRKRQAELEGSTGWIFPLKGQDRSWKEG